MTKQHKTGLLGHGIYTVMEAAHLARISPRMVNRWVFGSKSGSPVFNEIDYKDEPDRLVSFLEFIQLVAIREIRVSRNIPLHKFRQAIKTAKAHGFEYPFARRHCAYLWGDDLVLSPPGEEGKYFEASGKHRGQGLFQFVEAYLDDLSYDASGLANKYKIFQHGKIAIEMNPKIRFGEPILPSNYSAEVIWDAIQSEGSVEKAAKSYGITEDEVKASYQFYVKYLEKPKAA